MAHILIRAVPHFDVFGERTLTHETKLYALEGRKHTPLNGGLPTAHLQTAISHLAQAFPTVEVPTYITEHLVGVDSIVAATAVSHLGELGRRGVAAPTTDAGCLVTLALGAQRGGGLGLEIRGEELS